MGALTAATAATGTLTAGDAAGIAADQPPLQDEALGQLFDEAGGGLA